MNLKALVVQKGVTQLDMSKELGINHTLISLQLNKHKLLPEKHIDRFCKYLGISRAQLLKAMEVKND